jgi:hypothetical protein
MKNSLEKTLEFLHNNPPKPFNPEYNPEWSKDRPYQELDETDNQFDFRFFVYMVKTNGYSPEGFDKAFKRILKTID